MALRPPASRRRPPLAVVAAMLAATAVVGVGTSAGAASQIESNRLWGADRYETAVEIATEFVSEAGAIDTVIVASGESFADALAATPLANVLDAPILLTPSDVLHQATRKFIESHRITDLIIAGGPAAISTDVEDSLSELIDGAPERLEGVNRYRTVTTIARKIGANEIGSFCGDGLRTALLANGETFADALALSPLAFAGPHPALLTKRDRLPEAVKEYVVDLEIEQVVIAGGPAAIDVSVAEELEELGIEVQRLWGQDRFGTAVEIAQSLTDRCFDTDEFGLANGWKFPDALVGGTLLGLLHAPLLLSEQVLPDPTCGFLGSPTPDADAVKLTIFGGSAAVADSVVEAAIDALRRLDPDCDPRTDRPGVPRDFAVRPRDRGLEVSWRPPLNVGSAEPSGYRVRYRPVGGSWTTMRNVSSPTEITGLQNTTLYEVQVQADGDSYGIWTPSAWASPSSAATPGR
ncbi:cell wall-binding repeat-containing protein [Candidatus Poriferisodalis sp.]|uniref:cell wall-binding repeat-containing protein n=1 Tax=Candidatus Poriferisodalis sp. TaxID=3101277 RepID=UPI003C6F5B75